ncbi:MAG: hypothetical protein HOP12_08765 [Candidatus Eisenbacteria bacterium]|uniref:Uncharacterized protein n=1 Tax=Eiseniibacteriota bacterium TaxID=2212470 RepID=A0A849SNQ8_UNCEI|nr:hypothetical protein [Candidatus Eisenbacteria bacterium]
MSPRELPRYSVTLSQEHCFLPRLAALLVSLSLLAAAAPPSDAQLGVTGLMNLGWNDCGLTSANSNQFVDCSAPAAVYELVGSFRLNRNLTGFVGVSTTLSIRFDGASVPNWWAFQSAGCREEALTVPPVTALAGCANPYSGANQLAAHLVEPDSPAQPNAFQIRHDIVRDTAVALTGGTLYSAWRLRISSQNPNACEGCEIPACIYLRSMEVFRVVGPSVLIQSPEVRNVVTWQGGPNSPGLCPASGPTAAQRSTWGAVKSLYR